MVKHDLAKSNGWKDIRQTQLDGLALGVYSNRVGQLFFRLIYRGEPLDISRQANVVRSLIQD